VRLLLLSAGGGGGNILRSVKALFEQDLAVTERTDPRYAARLRAAVATRFLDTNEFSLTDVPPEERLLIGPRTTGSLGARHNPDVARQALAESQGEVEALLEQHAIVILIGTGGKGTGAGTMFALAQLARQHRRLVLPIFVRPSFERHEVDKRRYDHALNVIERFDAAGIRLMEILNDRGYADASPQPQSVVWERMNLPIARGLRGLIYVLWELSQVDPSDLSILFAGSGRLRIGFADIDSPAGQEPGDEEVEQAVTRCWDNPYYAFSKPPGTSLVCIQGEWSNVVDARIKGRLATLAMGGQNETAYTPLYARAAHSPRPWGVTMLLAEHTGAHQPLEVDWSFARESQALHVADAAQRRREALLDQEVHARAAAPPAVDAPAAAPAPPRPATATPPAPNVVQRRERREPREAGPSAAPFATLLEFAVAVNRADPTALALARDGARDGAREIPIDGDDVRKLLGTLWFRGVVPQLSAEWQRHLFDALRNSSELPDHVVRLGRRQARVSELGHAQLREAAIALSPADPVRQDIELLAAIAQIWGDDAIRQLPFGESIAPPPTSGLSGLLQGLRTRARTGMRGAP
jgi:cell division GTPase FtsZ